MDDNAQAVGDSTPDLTANGCGAWKCTAQHICEPCCFQFSLLQLIKLRGRRPVCLHLIAKRRSSVPARPVQVDPLAVARPWWIAPAVDAKVQLLLVMVIRGPSPSSSSSPTGLVKKQELLADGAGGGAASVVVVASAGSVRRCSRREADEQQVLVPLPLPLALGPLARGQAAVHRPIAAEVTLVMVEMLLLDLDAPRHRGSRDELRQLLRRRLAAVEVDALLGQRLLRLLQHGLQVLALRFDPQLQVSLNLRHQWKLKNVNGPKVELMGRAQLSRAGAAQGKLGLESVADGLL